MQNSKRERIVEALGLTHAVRELRSAPIGRQLPDLVEESLPALLQHGTFERWFETLLRLDGSPPTTVQLDLDCPHAVTDRDPTLVREVFSQLGPWKKGPFRIDELTIFAEWRSDLKWRRVLDLCAPLKHRRVLDVGTGNGYFLLRAVGEGASFVLGVEPSALFSAQFMALRRCFGELPLALLPTTGERFPAHCESFDTVLSMGVLYHRRSPLDHLAQLKTFLRPEGELILETLVVPGERGYSLLPEDRYAGMRNVWFVPSVPTLLAWLKRLGFDEMRAGPIVPTTAEEQRATSWSGPVSLAEFLDEGDPSKTTEGHPRPARVVIVAKKAAARRGGAG